MGPATGKRDREGDGVAYLARLHGLSPAEARLAAALSRGSSLADYAEAASLSINTVRWTLKRVFVKTDTHRQAELVRLLMSESPQPNAR